MTGFMKPSLLVFFAVIFIALGCSKSADTPLSADLPANDNKITNFPVGVSDWTDESTPSAGQGLLGLFNLHIDPVNVTADMSSFRKSSITDVLEVVDISNFLSLAPCTDCVKVKSISIDDTGHLVLSIGIRHPFAAGDPFKPISGKNRADLHVFNVEGIVVSNNSGIAFPQEGVSVSDFSLLNADGYTGYLDASLDAIYPTDATIHPYISHFDDYSQGNFDAANPMGFASVTNPPPSGNLVMPMGCDFDFQDYVFNIDGSMDFIFAVGCTYAVSAASKSQRFTPEYRIPQHNKKAASEVSIEIISNNLAGGFATSSAEVEIRVVDISNGVAVGDALDQVLSESNVDQITIEVPGVLTSPVIIDGASPISGTGHDPADPLVYQGTITNSAGAAEGQYHGLIKVKDSYAPGQNTSPLLGGNDGIKRVSPIENPLSGLFAITEFATYQFFMIDVTNPNINPVADAFADITEIAGTAAAVTFDATGSFDPDGTVDLYEWDFNNDGTFGGTGDEYTGNAWTPTHNFIVGSCYDVQLRVTDNLGATDELDAPLNLCPFKNMILRPGVGISDIATVKDTEEVLVMFDDHQVWKYDKAMNNGALLYQMPGSNTIGRRIEASDNGDSCCGWWDANVYNWYSYYANGTLATQHTFVWPNPPHNIELCVNYSTQWYPPQMHNLVGMFYEPYGRPAWFRSGYAPPGYTNFYGNYNEDLGPGPNRIDINYLKGVHASRNPATSFNILYLEGAPEWRVEKSYILIGFTNGWGGTQTDANTGFYNPKDITSNWDDRVYVTDILSTGERKIKKFDWNGNPFGSFGDNTTLAADPNRIDAMFSETPANNRLYVTMDDKVSIFFPSEEP